MSQQDVELVRRGMDAFNRRDRDAWIAVCHDDGELYSLRSQLEGRPYRGREDLSRVLDDIEEQWDYAQLESPEVRDMGKWIVVLCDFKARGRASGVELDFPVGVVFATRTGKISYARFYSDPAEALDAAGLSE